MKRIYACIVLQSFYASVECVERGLNPLTTNLVVADSSRTEKTICLAVSPSLKAYGLSGRSRLYEVVQTIKKENYKRRQKIYNHQFKGKSIDSNDLKNINMEIDYIVAKPRMAYYVDYSTKIYNVYLKYLSSDDIFVYSIDEVFCDITKYLKYYHLKPSELVTKMIQDVYKTTGITATAGIGTNMYLAKIAMDIVAKHKKPDQNGARIASLNEKLYRRLLWNHRPLTAFWRVGKGYLKKLEAHKLYTMGDIAKCSIDNEDLLFKLFGVNAEILIDHAWGYEPCTMKDIKSYKPSTRCLTKGQVLHTPYTFSQAKIIVREMVEDLTLSIVDKGLVTNQISLTLVYDVSNLNNNYVGEITTDYYGRKMPKYAHGTVNLVKKTSSTSIIITEVLKLYERIVNPNLTIRKVNISFNNLKSNSNNNIAYEQFNLFDNYDNWEEKQKNKKQEEEKENSLQKTMLNIKKKYGKNSLVKALDLSDGATTLERNKQIGGHNA